MTARAHVFVSGDVQGVGYRYSAVHRAEALGLGGWVRNLPDGRVEAIFEGPREKVEEAIAWCRQGPPSARVSGVEVRWEEPRGEKNFRITR
jgi:acylphosphatase